MNSILFYDGDCGFCQKSVQFVLKYERKPTLIFASLQGEIAATLLPPNLTQNLDSVVVYHNGKILTESNAVLFIVKKLKFPFFLFFLLKIVPVSIRDHCYQIISKNRHKFTKSRKNCEISKENTRKRFLD